MVQGGGFEPPKLSRQIYSLIHLATLEPLRHFSHANKADIKYVAKSLLKRQPIKYKH